MTAHAVSVYKCARVTPERIITTLKKSSLEAAEQSRAEQGGRRITGARSPNRPAAVRTYWRENGGSLFPGFDSFCCCCCCCCCCLLHRSSKREEKSMKEGYGGDEKENEKKKGKHRTTTTTTTSTTINVFPRSRSPLPFFFLFYLSRCQFVAVAIAGHRFSDGNRCRQKGCNPMRCDAMRCNNNAQRRRRRRPCTHCRPTCGNIFTRSKLTNAA